MKVSSIHMFCDVVMEEWKRTPVATEAEALVNSMPKRAKAVCWKIMVATQILTLLAQFGHFHLGTSGLDINGCVLSYLREPQIDTVIQAVHSLFYFVAKCNSSVLSPVLGVGNALQVTRELCNNITFFK